MFAVLRARALMMLAEPPEKKENAAST